MRRMGARCESCLGAAVRIQSCRRECPTSLPVNLLSQVGDSISELEGPVGSPVFDFSRYLIGKWLDGSRESGYMQILSASLRDEKKQEYNITYCYKAYGGDPCTPKPVVTRIADSAVHMGFPYDPNARVFSWSELGISESEWNAYKRWVSPVFDFSRYLIGKVWRTDWHWCTGYRGTSPEPCRLLHSWAINEASLLDEKTQLYRIKGQWCGSSPGYKVDCSVIAYFDEQMKIGEETKKGESLFYEYGSDIPRYFVTYTQYKWSEIGIPESDWNAYKLPCSMTDPAIDKPSAKIGEIIKISATLTNGIGADVTSYGDPAYLEFVDESNPPDYPVAASPATIWARYKWKACPPAGSTTLKLGPRKTGCDFEKSAAASCQVIIIPCVASDFATAEDKIYECGGASTCLNEYCASTGKKWRLTVKTTQPSAAVKYGPTEPGERTCSEKLADWKAKIDKHRRFCSKDNNYYWVTFPAELKDITPPTYECTASDFATAEDIIYECGGASECLNDYCIATGKKWRLTVWTTKPTAAEKYGPAMPEERTWVEMLADWNASIDKHRRFCSKDNNYYWVISPAYLEEIEKKKLTAGLLGSLGTAGSILLFAYSLMRER